MSTQTGLPILERRPVYRPVETVFAVALLLLLLFSIRDSLPQQLARNIGGACLQKVSENRAAPMACSQNYGRHNS